MKMGIERVLRENFMNLGEVLSVSPTAVQGPTLSHDTVISALTQVQPAVRAMGGAVEVLEVDSTVGKVRVSFKGPAKLKAGIALVLRMCLR